MKTSKKEFPKEHQQTLLATLRERFENNTHRHKKTKWDDVQKKLTQHPEKLWTLQQMEESGGEPDIVSFGKEDGGFIFIDCSAESPAGRRSLCYDEEALDARKLNKPKGSAVGMAKGMGANLISEEQYRHLQTLENFDTKTSSWIDTPLKVRKLGGALFCDRRFDTVFVYHNGAESYYAGRAFRCWISI